MSGMGITKTSTADFNQWLHAMRMVVRLPGEVPPEFRKKLWLSLAERYLHIKRMDWEREAVRCLSDKWKTDDEELADQIIKDLHRTGSSFCTGPSGSVNQAKLKRVLVGYARWNKEVGYCQGFNMLGALILQVVDTDEAAAIKIMIYLIEGVLPPGYFSGALTGLQADMGVFRELLSTRLPRLSKHLQKLQGLTSEALEPPLINVFTMQWFLTLFCTCLPLTCVLRIWDLILTDGGDIVLRTALALWELLETRILATRSADDFYSQMGTMSADMLSGSLIGANELVQRIVAMGPIHGLHKLRDKHLHNIAQWKDKRKKLRLFYSEDEAESDDDSKVAVATIWGLRLNRRGSVTMATTSTSANRNASSDREKIALDINLLKQQYGKLRQRQKQAQIILTAACARQANVTSSSFGAAAATSSPSVALNNLLVGRSAISKGRRPGAPLGAIPPARNASGKSKSVVKPLSKVPPETLHWKDTDAEGAKKRRNSLKWKDIPRVDKMGDKQVTDIEIVNQEEQQGETSAVDISRAKFRNRSESSSYSEDSDGNSSTSTSLCDDETVNVIRDSGSSLESSPFKKKVSPEEVEVPLVEKFIDIQNYIDSLGTDAIVKEQDPELAPTDVQVRIVEEGFTAAAVDEDDEEATQITSISQLSPVADLSHYLSSISPLKTPSSPFDLSEMLTTLSPSSENNQEMAHDGRLFTGVEVSEEGVTNTYFERIDLAERPSNLDLTDTESGARSLLEHNSTLSIPSYEIMDSDEPDANATTVERSTSLNVLQNVERSRRVTGGKEEEVEDEVDSAQVKRNCGTKVKEKKLKGKSSSLEETKRPILQKSFPVSCSETIEIRRSDKALEIIQENSKILHRILNKNCGSVPVIETEPVIESESVTEVTQPTAKVSPEMEKSPRRNTATITETLSSIEHTIKSINSLCQDRESESSTRLNRNRLMESIEEIINSGNAIKVQINSSDDINRKLNYSRSPSLSPIREKLQLHINGKEKEETFEYRPWSGSTFSGDSSSGGENHLGRLDKSPSSPIITRCYLESLKPSTYNRVTKSAENTPSRSLSRETTVADYDSMPPPTRIETKSIDDSLTYRDKSQFLLSSPTSLAFNDYGIEPRKHKSLEFDAI